MRFTLPPGLQVYAIGDIHGYRRILARMHDAIAADVAATNPQQVHVVYIGDYVDRGIDSAGVIEDLAALARTQDGWRRTFIKGNHEQAMLDFMTSDLNEAALLWFRWGGAHTLASYGVAIDPEQEAFLPAEIERARADFRKRVPRAHGEFLQGLADSVDIGDYFFTHAGVDPKLPLAAQKPSVMRVMREPFLSWGKPLEKMIVHGHTISRAPVVAPHRIGIDTGVYQGGGLTCAVLAPGQAVRFLQVT